jgi:hypothetical protein
VCLDASTSACGVATQPTIVLLDPGSHAVLGQSGGPTLEVTDQESIIVNGQAFDPGLVTLSVDSVSGTAFATATATGSAGAATFSVSTNTDAFSPGSHQLVAWETVGGTTLQASISLDVTRLP